MKTMLKRPTVRRTVLIGAGVAAVAAAAAPVAAQPADIRGTVTFAGGADIPEGRLEIYVDDPAVRDKAQRRGPPARLESDGKAKAIGFSLDPSAGPAASPTLRIVARLERADGWLLARGSAPVEGGMSVEVALSAVAY